MRRPRGWPGGGGCGLRLTPAATGRVNLHATGRGSGGRCGAIDAVNGVNPLITVATLPPFARVAEGVMVATIKIIAWGVPEGDLARACAVGASLRLCPPVVRTASLIETTVTGREPPVKGREALAVRLGRLGVSLGPRVVVPHTVEGVAAAVAVAEGDVVFVLTASATSDPGDVGPEGLRRAGERSCSSAFRSIRGTCCFWAPWAGGRSWACRVARGHLR